jgi:hypothetical protein
MKKLIGIGLVFCTVLVSARHEKKELKAVTQRALKEGNHWFYHNGDGQKVQKIVSKALEHFDVKKVKPHKKSVILVDVDNTALCIGTWKHAIALPFRTLPAIEQVHELYKELVDRGYKIVFLSSRVVPGWKFTRNNLAKAGYKKYEELITRSVDCPAFKKGDLKKSIGAYKKEARDRLREQGFTIIGSIGNSPNDFDKYTGYNVELPCYKGTVA